MQSIIVHRKVSTSSSMDKTIAGHMVGDTPFRKMSSTTTMKIVSTVTIIIILAVMVLHYNNNNNNTSLLSGYSNSGTMNVLHGTENPSPLATTTAMRSSQHITASSTIIITIQPERRQLHYDEDESDIVEYFFQVPPLRSLGDNNNNKKDNEMSSSTTTTTSTTNGNTIIIINGIVLLFHGCNRNGIDWFELPEERSIVQSSLLPKGFIVIAISSMDRTDTRCWSNQFPPQDNPDVTRIVHTLPKLVHEILQIVQSDSSDISTLNIPLYGIGASSGGMFVPILHHAIPFHGMSIMVSPGHRGAWQALAKKKGVTKKTTTSASTEIAGTTSSSSQQQQPLQRLNPIPRIAFVYMPKDTYYAGMEAIYDVIHDFLNPIHDNKGTYPATVQTYPCHPIPINGSILLDRLGGGAGGLLSISYIQAQRIIDVLASAPISILTEVPTITQRSQQQQLGNQPSMRNNNNERINDDQYYMLMKDPRSVSWESPIQDLIQDSSLFVHDGTIHADRRIELVIESIREVLNVAYGQHEVTREHMDTVVHFWLDDDSDSNKEDEERPSK